ncbi:MAG: LURP-one-related family protein [Acidobacteriota bacterium]|nr:LURP-one-related family protein [Acidobacteriota bacterium]
MTSGRPAGRQAGDGPPGRAAFTPAERRVLARVRTPSAVQQYLNALPYNTEPAPRGATLRSFRGVVRQHTAHCLEAAITAAVILEHHGWPPLVLSFESVDELDHVIFVYQHRGRWGSIARSRDPGLHGRRAVFRTPRALALSYVDPYVDYTGRITGYTVADLRGVGNYDWRLSEGNVWKVERMLLDLPHRPLHTSDRRIDKLRQRYVAYRKEFQRKPVYYRRRDRWSPLPAEFKKRG